MPACRSGARVGELLRFHLVKTLKDPNIFGQPKICYPRGLVILKIMSIYWDLVYHRTFEMFISHAASATNGFKKWSLGHSKGCNDNDRPGGSNAIALIAPGEADGDAPMTAEVAHRLSFRA
jgi:hypothetical protein